MALLTNREILALAKSDPTYQSETSKFTKYMFTQQGFEELNNTERQRLADFFGLSIRVVLNKIRTVSPRIPALYKDVVEEYGSIQGGIYQRINIRALKPTSPKYRNLVNGGSVDPWVVRKPETDERFYGQNFDFQNFLTIQDIELEKMFLTEDGISSYIAGIMKSLDDAYVIQKYEMFRDMISNALNSTKSPLKDSQIIEVPVIAEGALNKDQAKYLQILQNLYTLMEDTVKASEFNAKSFEHGLYPDEYVLMIRADVYNIIKTSLLATTYHTQNLAIPFKVRPVKDFGGLTYKQTSTGTPLVPVYDQFGAVKGFGVTEESDPIDPSDITKVDPNANVSAVLMQKGTIFTTTQKPYTVKTIYNPAGEYTNFWANQPNSAFNYDATYDIIKFVNTTSAVAPVTPIVEPTEEPTEEP